MNQPGESKNSPFRRFVVLRHTDRHGVHYDLMIDQEDSLATWKFTDPPKGLPGGSQQCVRIADHRRVYLDYEGPISGGRGEVKQHDAGTVAVTASAGHRWEIEFRGNRLRGAFTLERQGNDAQSWVLRPAG